MSGVHRFYTALREHDWRVMNTCYHADARFHDPVFGDLDVQGGGLNPALVKRYIDFQSGGPFEQRRLRKLERWLRDEGHAVRHSVDSRPVFERAWAVRAGVGFVGKNSCLIVPGVGSHVFLSTLVTSAPLAPDAPIREGCGRCTACLDACPTDAFVSPRVLDARRCISNLTIEREDLAAPDLLAQTGDWLFGCDACQDVCPYNRTTPGELDPAFEPHARLGEVDLEALLSMSDERFLEWSEGSPMRRAGVVRMARNAAVVLGHRGGRRHLPVLREAAAQHDDATVREAAAWAAARIERRDDE